MCGIAGVFRRDGAPVDADSLVRMTRTLSHRGPDEEGYYRNAGDGTGSAPNGVRFYTSPVADPTRDRPQRGDVGLGHRRLSIIDLASGQQPLCNEDGTVWIAFNGEIYNFQSLAPELEQRGHRFRTRSDTEAIVHAYEEWGDEFLTRLRGMFAFALWDARRERLLLARDRVGKKPLYYLLDERRLLFGSEIKAILAVDDVPRDIEPTALSDYLSLLYVPAPKSIFRAIRKLPAAHYAVIDRSASAVRPYWDLSFEDPRTDGEPAMIDDLMSCLDESTRMRMISEVPLGAFLSGGVDSSAVVALMARASTQPVVTNSIAFSVASYDETPHARRVAELFRTDHHEYRVTPEAVPVVERLAWHYDEPFADSSAVPTYYVSKTARERVTVALSGDGGDESFAGYRRYYFDLRENAVRSFLPGRLGRGIFAALGGLYPKADYLPQVFRGKAFLSNLARDPVDAYCFSVSAFWDDRKRSLLRPELQAALGGYRTAELFHDLYRNAPADDHLSRIQYLDVKTYLCDDILTKVDRASMAVSLEVRCPILDHVFMERAARIPWRLKLDGQNGKHIFKRALEPLLPREILHRKKMGFGVPILEWLRGELAGYAEDLVLRGAASREFFEPTYLERIWSQHQRGTRNWATELWAVLMLNLWYRNFGVRSAA
jgi:asparagine synthase (glutamine-hydrolysing)